MTSDTVGREVVQIVEIVQPICGNTFSVSPCTATGTGDTKCYNTRSTCQDGDNFRYSPSWLMTPTHVKETGDTISSGELSRDTDIFAKFVVTLPISAPDGVIWEQGGATTGAYLGFTGGDLIFRAGDATASDSSTTAKVIGDMSQYLGKRITIYVGINAEWFVDEEPGFVDDFDAFVDTDTNSVSVWVWDAEERCVDHIGTDVAAATWGAEWAGGGGGAIGEANGNIPVGESAADFTGVIHSAEFYNETSAPEMEDNYRLRLFFSKGNVAERRVEGAPYIIPSLASVSTQPTKINLSTADLDATGLGLRAVCNIVFNDHPHTDRRTDPYLSERTFDPYERSSFWVKWLNRNKYRQNMIVRVYEGYAGQALSEMTKRQYFMQSIRGPDQQGNIVVEGKDILARVEDRKAQVPSLSQGQLFADIDDVVTSIEASNVTTADYPASGTIRVNDEIMTYSSVASSTNGITFTISARGTDNTEAAEHAAADTVQECYRVSGVRVDAALEDLLVNYAGVPAAYLDDWDEEATAYLNSYNLNTLITEPEGVAEVVSRIQEQALCFLWWDERVQKVKFKAVRGIDGEPDTITDSANIVAGSFSVTEMPRQRASQVWMYFNRSDFVKSRDDPSAYANARAIIDLDSESAPLYGEASVRDVFADFINTSALAVSTTSKIITRYVDVPRACTFELDAKDRDYWTGSAIQIDHYREVDSFGARKAALWTITSAEEIVPGEKVRYTAEDTTLYGRISVILDDAIADYQGDGTDQTNGAWISDADGLYSNGDRGARIS